MRGRPRRAARRRVAALQPRLLRDAPRPPRRRGRAPARRRATPTPRACAEWQADDPDLDAAARPAGLPAVTVAVISDVHGNAWALDAVLADAPRRGATTFLDLGDTLDGPLDPTGTADRLMTLGALTVRGNHDRLMLEGGGAPIGAEHRDVARHLPARRHVRGHRAVPRLAARRPRVPASTTARPTAPARAAPRRSRRWSTAIDAGLILCGHTHVAAADRAAGRALGVQPGQRRAAGVPRARGAAVGDRHGQPARPLRAPAPRRRALARRAPLRRLRLGRAAAAARAAGNEDWIVPLATGWPGP